MNEPEPETVTVSVPAPLRVYCDGAATLSVAGASVREVLAALEEKFPMLHRGVCDETGKPRRHINLFVNIANVRDGEGVDTPVAPGDVVTILPAVSGGAT